MAEVLHGEALHPLIYAAADTVALPRECLLALTHAEAGRRSDAERWAWYDRATGRHVNLTDRACAAIAADDRAGVQAVIDEIVGHGSKDISVGCTQQTFYYCDERYERGHALYQAGWTADAVLAYRTLYLDPHHALARAAIKLSRLFDRADIARNVLYTLFAWNRPAARYDQPPNAYWPTVTAQAHYREALRLARLWVAADEIAAAHKPQKGPGMIDDAMYLPIWQAVQPDIPFDRTMGLCQFWTEHYRELGSPLTAEQMASDGGVYQVFAHGIVRWTGRGGEIV